MPDGQPGMYALRDPSGIAEGVLTLSEPALYVLTLFDGKHTLSAARDLFFERYGQAIKDETLTELVDRLRTMHMIDGPEFESHLADLEAKYREAPTREATCADFWSDANEARESMSQMIPKDGERQSVGGHVVGLVAPHLDYPRGNVCYSAAYQALVGRERPARVCIFGTNHFGRSTSVVATGKAFETPFGTTQVDLPFLEAIEQSCGQSLRDGEFDHKREHSVELQVMCLQHLFGADGFTIVPFLCPDPCGPSGLQPYDGQGVPLDRFARAVADAMAEFGDDTLLVTGADLSHVGSQFGDEFDLNEAFLTSVERSDRAALDHLTRSDPDAFVAQLTEENNATRVCSAGCMYVAATVLRDATPTLLHYHQAFDPEQQVCVTCSAMVYTQ
jgi:MEMO1 family protein